MVVTDTVSDDNVTWDDTGVMACSGVVSDIIVEWTTEDIIVVVVSIEVSIESSQIVIGPLMRFVLVGGNVEESIAQSQFRFVLSTTTSAI